MCVGGEWTLPHLTNWKIDTRVPQVQRSIRRSRLADNIIRKFTWNGRHLLRRNCNNSFFYCKLCAVCTWGVWKRYASAATSIFLPDQWLVHFEMCCYLDNGIERRKWVKHLSRESLRHARRVNLLLLVVSYCFHLPSNNKFMNRN